MIADVGTHGGTKRPLGRATAAGLTTGLAALVLAACGGSSTDGDLATATTPAPVAAAPAAIPAEPAAPPATVPATTAPPTTIAPTTIAPTTAPPTISTEPPATIALEHAEPEQQETEPIQPPADAWSEEPIIEMGTISIPKLDVSMTMYEGVRLTTLERGPGHWPGSALPGQTGNVVVGGHRVSSHAVFRHVDDLVAGDEIVFEDESGRHVYLVRDVQIIDPYDVWIVDPTETPTATLFACHPPGSTAQRIAVFADLVTG